MTELENYEILVVGGGKAGKTLAMDMALSGRRVALVEREFIGGSCINVACIPAKSLIRSAQVANVFRIGQQFGVSATDVTVDMPSVAARTASVVAGMVGLHRKLFADSGLELVMGVAKFIKPRVIETRSPQGQRRHLTGDRIFLNLGTKAALPELPGLLGASPLTHVEALLLDRLPDKLLILGGGYVGLEMAQAFHRLGSSVTVIERGPQLAPHEDPDVAAAILNVFREDGISVLLGANVVEVSGRSGDHVSLHISAGSIESIVEGSHLLVAVGRVPQTAGIGLDVTGVRLDSRGFIQVNERLATTAPGIWALGEVAGSPMFTHVSMDDYRVAKSVIVGGARTTRERLIPHAVFIEPELGRVGISEGDAKQQGIAIRVARLPMSAVPRARTLSETRGFMKAIVEEKGDGILGFSMLGAHAGEVVAVVQAAMWGSLPYTKLRDGILAHPTMAEGLNMLFSNLPESSI